MAEDLVSGETPELWEKPELFVFSLSRGALAIKKDNYEMLNNSSPCGEKYLNVNVDKKSDFFRHLNDCIAESGCLVVSLKKFDFFAKSI